MGRKDVKSRAEYDREYRLRPEVKARQRETKLAWDKANRAKRNVTMRNWRQANRAANLIFRAKKRAEAKGLDFDLKGHVKDLQDRIDRGFCELTGYPFDFTLDDVTGYRRFDSPSLDRIDNDRGYTYDNVRVVLSIVNYALNVYGEDVLRAVMTKWLIEQ